ncbi:hypothetical protein D881_02065 [Corynebacterium ulcerans NCTC 12077]|uniref:Integral membrane protein n=1 Tax=Corynebacterium ulcerans FRC58 TaxID=1408268 RepID=A0ABM5TYH0_CORUL|nr:hypothetical protein [Corynebacterium ulcerans]AKN76182.1 Hypothetical protein CulFRC58_0328 [Corynebacterium ulcerans FRC58]ESU58658.1 hypothetical protein D881_02065 [Corynebacterium ulcerans NCTC 12077]
MPIERLPMKVQPAAYRVRAFLMTDSTAIIILGIGILARGLSYLPIVLGPPPSKGAHPAEGLLPIEAWGLVWVIVGILCLLAAFTKQQVLDVLALCAGVALNCLWGFSFIQGAIIAGQGSRLWVSSIGYFSIVALVMWAVWRGKRGDIPLSEDEKGRGA